MLDEDFYILSGNLNAIVVRAKSLLGLNLLRYKHIVDNSPKGFDCTYAKLSRRHHEEDREREINTLKQMQHALNALIKELEDAT